MKNKILFVLCLLFGLMLINSGLNKLLNYIPVPEGLPEEVYKDNQAFEEIGWLMPLVAIAEIIGGLLFIIKKYRPLGALIVFPVMVGVILNHIVVFPQGLPMALVFFAINVAVIIINKEKYLPLIRE